MKGEEVIALVGREELITLMVNGEKKLLSSIMPNAVTISNDSEKCQN